MKKNVNIEEMMIHYDLIDEIMDNFDFSKIAKVMKALDWKWVSVDGIPEESDIRAFARKILKNAINEKATISCGGFKSVYSEDEDGHMFLSLEFVVDEDYSEWPKESETD